MSDFLFDSWNLIKKNTQHRKNKKYHAGDIWWCNLGQNIGFEQNGSGENFERPVLVLKGFNKNICFVVPLTKRVKVNKFYFNVGIIDDTEACAILSQLRLIDTKRFINQIGFLGKEKLVQIKKAIQVLIE